MFNWLFTQKTNAARPKPEPAKAESVSPGNTFLRDAEGFWLPQYADSLLSSPVRQHWLQQISPVVALPEREYRTLCLAPLKTLAESLQCVPAARSGQYQGEGGLLDLTLHTTAWCVRMSQKEMLPRGMPSEEQSRQFSAWNVCVFYTGLLYWLPLAMQFDGQLNTLSPWQPGLTRPAVPFRFRFRDPVPDSRRLRQTGGALMTVRLLPTGAVEWLSGYPAALAALTEVLTGQAGEDNDLIRILHEALAAFEAGSLPDVAAEPGSLIVPPAADVPAAPRAGTALVQPAVAVSPVPDGQTPDTGLPSAVQPGQETEVISSSPAQAPAFELAAPDAEAGSLPVTGDNAPPAPLSDPLVPPDGDLEYALMLSGVLPAGDTGSTAAVQTESAETAITETMAVPPVSGEEPASTACSGDDAVPVPSRPQDEGVFQTGTGRSDNAVPADVLAADFTDWLKRSLGGESLPLNRAGSPVHAIAGYLFLRSPRIFTLYLSQCPYSFERYQPVQRAFESLRLHRRGGNPSGGLVHCRLRKPGPDDAPPVWQKAAGYLVKSQLLLPGADISDSPYIEFD